VSELMCKKKGAIENPKVELFFGLHVDSGNELIK